MCGIAGVKAQNQVEVRSVLLKMLDAIHHRGFSQNELIVDNNWAIGMNRLQIVDEANGTQPFISNNNRYICVFNGEIYNFLQLKKRLEGKGYKFKSNCDSEVVVMAYEEWGVDSFEKLDGMFALAIYDKQENNFILARDPFGIKPLYYTKSEAGFLFASEIKALEPLTNQIEEFPPGHYRIADNNICYRDPLKYVNSENQSEDDNPKILRELISAAVKKRVQTKLPVAVLLSGGIDSSIVMYEAMEHHDNVTAFVVGKADAEDCMAAIKLCEELNTKIVHIDIGEQDLIDSIEETVFAIESFEPNHIRGGTLSLAISKVIAEHGFKIALCGEGADEIFWGYDEFRNQFLAEADDIRLNSLGKIFVSQLHKTQLQRVDRTAMKHTLEVRVPFLDQAVAEYALNAPPESKIVRIGNAIVTKFLLRQAYKDILPDYITTREKAVFSYGAGFGSNGEEGPFYTHANATISDDEFDNFIERYASFKIKNKEEMLYFTLYLRHFGEQNLAKCRPSVNKTKVLK